MLTTKLSFMGRKIIWILLIAASLLLGFPRDERDEALQFADFEIPRLFNPSPGIASRLSFVQESGGPASVHSGTLTRLQDGIILAAWFGGTREGAKDVQIYLSRRQTDDSGWSVPMVIAWREQTSADLNRDVSKIGNPILFTDSRGRVWLFYVTVSFGGWSGSSITVRFSDDDGHSWSRATRLVTSPFLNVSTLVKGAPIECESGHILLPVYHEFIKKFGEALLIDREGRLVSKIRLTAEQGAIQPWIVPLDKRRSRAFYRQSGHSHDFVLSNFLPDIIGSKCDRLVISAMPNPDSAIAVIRRHNGEFLMACNPIDDGRYKLSLATSRDGETWKTVRTIEESAPPGEFSYPYLIRGSDGQYHLIYTWNRSRIRYMTFDEKWLEDSP
jgi:predicted neuraminidase